ncbi:hypothetical protein [Prochlorococcus marinus]|uniref:hypothetical protein n=1 Tax=Prochlorococcus marinus TaxID=1219 RepID=UPI0007BAF160|nr:hypothetical protein PMIT1320_01651 [Prochlorococcus marinus str. MIT 1320]
MEINLKDAVRFNWVFQGALQGAGAWNQAGIGFFITMIFNEEVLLVKKQKCPIKRRGN